MSALDKIGDDATMARMGRLQIIKDLRRAGVSALRDCVTRLNSGEHADAEQIAQARAALDQIEQAARLWEQWA